jgi:hypothetical protein
MDLSLVWYGFSILWNIGSGWIFSAYIIGFVFVDLISVYILVVVGVSAFSGGWQRLGLHKSISIRYPKFIVDIL